MNDLTQPFTLPKPQAPAWREAARWARRAYAAQRLRWASGEGRKRWNAELNWREFWHGRTSLRSFPRVVQVGTNWTCNLKCSFCRLTMPWTQADLKKLPPAQLQISDRVAETVRLLLGQAEMLTLTPLGEPLLWGGLKDLLAHHAKLGTRNLALTTNGMLLTDAMAERLVRGELATLFCSIDTNDPQVYSGMRVGGDLRQVEEGIRRVVAWKKRLGVPWPRLVVNSTFMARNIPQLPSMVNWAKGLGFSEFSVQLMEIENPEQEAESLTHHAPLVREMVSQALARGRQIGMRVTPHLALRNLISAAAEGREVGRHEFSASSPKLPEELRKYAGTGPTEHDGPQQDPASGEPLDTSLDMRGKTLVEKCHYPWYNLLIDTDGDARPCCWASTSWGNLNQMTFDEIWNGAKAQAMRRAFLANAIPASCRGKHCRVDL